MDEETKNIKEEILEGRIKHGFVKVNPCSSAENKEYRKLLKEEGELPENIRPDEYVDGIFYKISDQELSDAEKMEHLAYKQLSMMATIRNLIIGLLVLGFILLIVSFSILSKTNVIFDYVESVKKAVSDFTYDLNSFFRSISRW